MRPELNVLAMIKGQEHYVYIYDDVSATPLLETLQDQAADPRLSLTWFDVAILSQKVSEQVGSTTDPLDLRMSGGLLDTSQEDDPS